MAQFFSFAMNDPTGSTLLNRLVSAISSAFAALEGAMLTDAIVTAAIGVADTRVYHGLGHKPRGYVVCGLNAGAIVYSGTDDGAQAKYLNLKASAPVTATLLFF